MIVIPSSISKSKTSPFLPLIIYYLWYFEILFSLAPLPHLVINLFFDSRFRLLSLKTISPSFMPLLSIFFYTSFMIFFLLLCSSLIFYYLLLLSFSFFFHALIVNFLLYFFYDFLSSFMNFFHIFLFASFLFFHIILCSFTFAYLILFCPSLIFSYLLRIFFLLLLCSDY
jgi:hypothetical protein